MSAAVLPFRGPAEPPAVAALKADLNAERICRRKAELSAGFRDREAQWFWATAVLAHAEAVELRAECASLRARVEELEREAAARLVADLTAGRR